MAAMSRAADGCASLRAEPAICCKRAGSPKKSAYRFYQTFCREFRFFQHDGGSSLFQSLSVALLVIIGCVRKGNKDSRLPRGRYFGHGTGARPAKD